MITVGMLCHTPCPSCKEPIPVNALVDTLFCSGCSHVVRLSGPGLTQLLAPALERPGALGWREGRRKTVWTPDGAFDVSFTRMMPRCETCKRSLDLEAGIPEGASLACTGCGSELTVRPPPAGFGPEVFPGVSHLIGEDADLLAATVAGDREPVKLTCSSCSGTLSVDGRSRVVSCQYCSAEVMLPDEVWQRLHPARTGRRWFLVLDQPGSRVAQAAEPLSWMSVYRAVVDPEGRLICLGRAEGSSGTSLWAMDSEMRTLWVQRDVDGPCLTLRHDGQVLLWSDEEHSAKVFSCEDGLPSGTVGEREPQGAAVHHLDLVKLEALTCDLDGSYLALFYERLLRFGPDGVGRPTWKKAGGLFGWFKRGQRQRSLWSPCETRPSDQLQQQLYDAGRSRIGQGARGVQGFNWMNFKLEKVGHRPLAFGWPCDARPNVGFDGCLYVLGKGEFKDHLLARFDRSGDRRYVVKLPIDDFEYGVRVGADAAGNAYIFGKQNSPRGEDYRVIVRVSPDGTVTELVRDRQLDGPLHWKDERLAVAPDGRFYVLGASATLKAFEPDGTVRFIK